VLKEIVMRKPISTRAHGMFDYTWTAAASALSARDSATSTAQMLQKAATVARTTSMITNYEGGTLRVLPVKAHLAVDVALCSVLIASPWLVPKSERRFAAIPFVLGIIGLVTTLLTETRSPMEIDEEQGFFGPHGAVASVDQDPDIVAHPHLRAHLE
jgi:hypothetical protein